jgi:hypothetical protein
MTISMMSCQKQTKQTEWNERIAILWGI